MKTNASLTLVLVAALALGSFSRSGPAEPVPSAPGGDPLLGEILWVPYNFAPRGWAMCNGQLLSIAQNSALFSLLGTTYGGDGRTTFALPDLRGRVTLHAGQGAGLKPRRLGERGGAETVTLTQAQMPSHAHALAVSTNEGAADGSPAAFASASGAFSSAAPTGTADVVGAAGGGQAHQNMPPYVTLHAVIAVNGTFPTRH